MDDRPEFWLRRGEAERMAGKMPQALKSYRRAVKLDEDSHDIWMDYGDILFDAGNFRKAKEAYKKATELSSDCGLAWFQLAGTFLALNQWDEFVSTLSRALAMDPKNKVRFRKVCPVLAKDPKFCEAVGLELDE